MAISNATLELGLGGGANHAFQKHTEQRPRLVSHVHASRFQQPTVDQPREEGHQAIHCRIDAQQGMQSPGTLHGLKAMTE